MLDVRGQMMRRAGLFGSPRAAPATPPAAQSPAEPRKPGTLRRIAGYLADFTAGMAGREGPYAAMLADQQERAEQLRAASLDRDTDWQDWLRRQQWERANPAPRTNDTVADYEFIRQRLGDAEAEKFLRNRADPPRYVQGPDGQFYPMQTAQPRVLGESLPEGWTIQGGTAGNGGGNFPR